MSRKVWRIIGRRLAQILPVVVLATLVVFMLLQLVPGDPAITLAGENATPEQIARIRHLYELDQPALVQYLHWLFHASQGDLAHSLMSGEDVARLIVQSLPPTLLIVMLALAASLMFGTLLGMLAATYRGTWIDGAITTFASLGVALPSFWLGMILINSLALEHNLFPATGMAPLTTRPGDALWHAALPAAALAAGGTAEIVRQLRSAMLETLQQQHIRTLHAKGLSPVAILWRHALKNISATLLTVIGLLFNRLLGATVVIEAIFAIPGIGSLVVRSAIAKDFPVVQGVILVMVLLVIAGNLLTDTLLSVFDPRTAR